jgi:hypothetical protein
MSKIYSGCAPLHAGRITAGFDCSCACFWPIEANSATNFSAPQKSAYLTLKDLAKLHWLEADRVTKDTSNATMMRRLRSFEDRQAECDDGFDLAMIASGFCSSSVSRLASAPLESGRCEQLNLLPSDRHTRGPRLWQ